MKRIIVCLVVALCELPLAGQALNIKVEGERAFLSGDVDYPDARRLEEAFAKGVKTLVLTEVGTGRVNALMSIGDVVGKAGVGTVAVGNCLGGCPFLFVRGRERLFAAADAAGRPTAVFLRGAVATGSGVPARATEIYAYFKRHLSDRVPAKALSYATTQWQMGRALAFFAPAASPVVAKGSVAQCSDTRDLATCAPIDGLDLLSSGMLTSVEPYAL